MRLFNRYTRNQYQIMTYNVFKLDVLWSNHWLRLESDGAHLDRFFFFSVSNRSLIMYKQLCKKCLYVYSTTRPQSVPGETDVIDKKLKTVQSRVFSFFLQVLEIGN